MVGRLNIIGVLKEVFKDKPQLKINDLCINKGQEEGKMNGSSVSKGK